MIPSVQVDFFRCLVEEFGGGNRNGGEKSDGKWCSDAWGDMLAVVGINSVTHGEFVGQSLKIRSGSCCVEIRTRG
jgi:hypothetical protein